MRREDPALAETTAETRAASEGLRVSTTLGFLVTETARLLRRRFIHHAKADGLPLTYMLSLVLMRISQNEGISQATLAALLDIEPITLARSVDRLAEAGLAERRLHPSDRRIRTLWLTPDAHPMLDRIRAVKTLVRIEAFGGFEVAERTRFLEELFRVRSNLNAASAAVDLPFELEE
jgi:MarR family transcriptional regulator for hemolysin